MTEQEIKRLNEIELEISKGNTDPKLFNERNKLLNIRNVKILSKFFWKGKRK